MKTSLIIVLTAGSAFGAPSGGVSFYKQPTPPVVCRSGVPVAVARERFGVSAPDPKTPDQQCKGTVPRSVEYDRCWIAAVRAQNDWTIAEQAFSDACYGNSMVAEREQAAEKKRLEEEARQQESDRKAAIEAIAQAKRDAAWEKQRAATQKVRDAEKAALMASMHYLTESEFEDAEATSERAVLGVLLAPSTANFGKWKCIGVGENRTICSVAVTSMNAFGVPLRKKVVVDCNFGSCQVKNGA